MMTSDIVCFGEAMVELSAIQETSCRIGIGGDTFNTAVYLARAGHDVAYATAVGDCPFSTRLIDTLKTEAISTETALRLPGQSVGLYAISVDDEGERSFTYWRSQSAVRSMLSSPGASKIIDAMRNADTLYLTGITLSLFDDQDREQIFSLLEDRCAAEKRNVFDGNYRPRNWANAAAAREAIVRCVALATWSLPTFDDEQMLFGDTSPEATAERHRALGANEVIVKHGAAGALINGDTWIKPPATVKPLDTTGAGDSFNAGYIQARLEGHDSKNAVLAGHSLAGRVLKVPGALIPREDAHTHQSTT